MSGTISLYRYCVQPPQPDHLPLIFFISKLFTPIRREIYDFVTKFPKKFFFFYFCSCLLRQNMISYFLSLRHIVSELPVWRNGRRSRLKICRPQSVRVQVPPSALKKNVTFVTFFFIIILSNSTHKNLHFYLHYTHFPTHRI